MLVCQNDKMDKQKIKQNQTNYFDISPLIDLFSIYLGKI